MFAALGVQVTVIDQRQRPRQFLDHEIVDELIHQLRKSDVTFRCGDAVEHIEIVHTPQRKGVLELASSKHLVADADLVFRRPCRRDRPLAPRSGRTEA